MKEEVALMLKEYLFDTYNIELGELASKQVVDHMYPIIEDSIYEETKMKIKNETVHELIHSLQKEYKD
ncbi:DUF2164 domain-containing protein [Macrococcoides canis]|uniref:DUF2164 family protein n=1 Tax=Macrococcoides canis TaxID=1855823 RepID=A0A1W7A827_9STAP|nr:hypothetical protein [Macrococcus canis]ARQ05782.1 hypothetical protein MCCS_01100 [Macrococcus canis]UJS27888.1 hypothetical protein L2Z53_00600 [Macrococcus canis]UTH00164.1 hypothetical protein KFV04_00345 [Macrococcus canis]